MNDLYEFDPSLLRWTNLTGSTCGSTPPSRCNTGLASVMGKLYLFGGSGSNGGKQTHIKTILLVLALQLPYCTVIFSRCTAVHEMAVMLLTAYVQNISMICLSLNFQLENGQSSQ